MIKKLKSSVLKNKDKGLVLFDQGLVSGVNFLMGILLARFLGAESFGIYAVALMLLYFVSSLHQAILIAPLFSLSAQQTNPQKWENDLNTLQLLFSSLCFFLMFGILWGSEFLFPEWELKKYAFVVSVWLSLFVFHDFIRRQFLLKKKPSKTLGLDALNYGFQLLAVIGLYGFEQLNLERVFWVDVGAHILSISYFFVSTKITFSKKKLRKSLIAIWQYSRYLVATAILQWSSGNYFILMAAALLGPIAVGAIRIAQNLMGVLNVLFLTLENIIPAKAAELYHQNGVRELQSYFKKITKIAALPTFCILGIMAVFHKLIIQFVYGAQYSNYSYVLLAFCGIYVFIFLGTMLRFIIRTLELNQVVFWSYVATTAFSLLFAKSFVNQLGLLGVVLGIAISQAITLFILLTFLKRKVKWDLKLFTWS